MTKKLCVLLLCALTVSSCALPAAIGGRSTAKLTTPGIVALHTLEVVKVLDVLRDVAVDGEAARIIATEDARKIVTTHREILLAAKEAPNGWKPTALTALYNLRQHLSPAAMAHVEPYIEAVLSLLKGVL